MEQKKKIVIVSPAHPLRGGIAALSERLAETLLESGHQVVIYSFSLQYPAFLFPGKTQFTTDPAPDNLLIKTRLNAINPFNWLRTGWQIAQEHPDQVIVRYWMPFMGPCLGSTLRVARWLSRQPLRITALVDNLIPHEKRPGDRVFSHYFTGACDDFLAMSKSVADDIKAMTTRPVRVSPHPLYDHYGERTDQETARKALNLPLNVPSILFFGFIRRYKGLDLMLEALAACPGVHAIVAGERYEDWSPYQAIIDRHQLADRVHLFPDFIPNDQVRYFFSAADLVVQPYRQATQSGISQIAYHFEQPMVVTNVGGLPEIVEHEVSGLVALPSPAEIGAAIRHFFEDKLATKFASGIQRKKEEFGWGKFAKKILER
jgi:glycosyltransferase involved in cell wall biosynthesis